NNGEDNKDPGDGSNPIDSEKVKEFLAKYWQPIVTLISILLILIFTGKGLGYASKRRKIKKTIEKKYSTYYAVSGTGLFGLPNMTWTIVASIMAGVAVLSFIFMLLEKRTYSKAEEELEEAKEEYARNEAKHRDDEMQMMFMRMMGGNSNGGAQGGYAYAQQPMLGAEEMRGMINEAVTALLPSVQQYLPQQASVNDEIIQKLVAQNEQNEERINQLTAQNEELIKNLAQEQELFMKQMSELPKEGVSEEILEKLVEKLSKSHNVEHAEEKEVAAANVSEDAIKELNKSMAELKEVVEKMADNAKPTTSEHKTKEIKEVDGNSEKIEMLMRNQEMLMKQIVELASNKNNEKQVLVPIMPQPIIQQPSEKVIERVVEKPVEKIVEKEVSIKKPAPKAKTAAPRLSLDEAYEKLSAKQKKIFDTLKAYAMSKDKCKEKKSTYYIVLGQSSVNPLVKLTIKKDTTVALFKMEDEFMKDIRRNATNDGTKVKVKETELVVADMQALATAKEMVDLREDQIERYNEYLKEQRAMKK
ncbi:MAG: hypothetical protein K2O95_03800, partial [Clostridia bacterium]|nr:hypothetical protein [Clostridia bacterium]